MYLNENTLPDNFLDVSVRIGSLQLSFILQPGFFHADGDWAVPSHFHACHEFHYIYEGVAELYAGDKTFFLSQGDVCMIPPHLTHYTKNGGKSAGKVSLLLNLGCAQKTGEDSGCVEYEIYSKIYSCLDQAAVIHSPDIYRKYLKNIPGMFKTNNLSRMHKIKALFTLMFFELTEQFADCKVFAADYETNAAVLRNHEEADQIQNTRILKIENYINSHFMEDIQLSCLSNYLYLSEKQTDRILKKFTGLSFGKLLQKKRMTRASELLLHSELSFNEIALQIGYHSYNGFCTAFKNYFGVSPKSFRQQ